MSALDQNGPPLTRLMPALPHARTTSAQHARRHLVTLVLLALAVQLLFAFVIFPLLAGPLEMELDPDRFGELGLNWATGAGFNLEGHPFPVLHRGPGQPLLLALVARVAGPLFDPAAVIVLSLLGTATVVVTYLLARRLLADPTLALLAGAATAVHPLIFWFAPRLRYEPLLTLLLLLAVYGGLKLDAQPRRRTAVVVGLVSGYAALTSQTFLFWPLVLGLYLLLRLGWRTAVPLLLLVAVTIGAVIAPWTLRNYRTFSTFVPVHSGGITHFVKGTFEFEQYDAAPLQARKLNRISDVALADLLGRNQADFNLREPGLDAALAPLVWADLRARPAHYLAKVAVQMPRFYYLSESALKSGLLGLIQGTLVLFGVVGTVALWRRVPGIRLLVLTILYLNLLHAVTRVEVRFSTPITPLLVILAVAGARALWWRRPWPRAIGLFLAGLFAMTAVACATPPTPTVTAEQPTPETVTVTTLGRPRIFFDAAGSAALPALAATTHADIWQPIDQYTAALVGVNPPAQPPPNADLDTFRTAGNALIPLAFACVTTGDDARCDTARDHLLAYAGWSQWDENGWRSLGHAHLLQGGAIAFDWLYERLTPAERTAVANALGDRAAELYDASRGPKNEAWNNWYYRSYLQNHYSTVNAALGIAALALTGEDIRANVWLNHAVERLSYSRAFLEGIGDGSWHESIHYQNYALTVLLPFLTNARRLAGVDLLPESYLRTYPLWRTYNYLPHNATPALSYGNFELDWGNAYRPQNILRFVAAEYGDGRAEWVAQELIAVDGRHDNVFSTPWYVFEFLYYDPTIPPVPPDDLPLTGQFDDLGAVVWREGWMDDDLVVTFKAGPFGGRNAFDSFVAEDVPWESPCVDTGCQLNIGHDHEDVLNFSLYQAGTWLLPERVGYNIDEPEFHNTLLVDGRGQYEPDSSEFREPDAFRDSDSALAATAHGRRISYAAGDAGQSYGDVPGIERIIRHLFYLRSEYVLVVDSLAADAPHQYTWIAHFDAAPAVEGRWLRSTAPDGRLLGVERIAPVTTLTSGDDGRPYIWLQTPSVPVTRFVNLLYPSDAAGWAARPTSSVLHDGDDAVVVHTIHAGGAADDIILLDVAPGGVTAVANYLLDGRAALVGHNGDGSLRRIFLSGGTTLRDQSGARTLLANPGAQTFEAHFDGTHVDVTGDAEQLISLYAPDVATLTLNGMPWSFERQGDIILFGVQPNYVPVIRRAAP